jgi:hypothetical protein
MLFFVQAIPWYQSQAFGNGVMVLIAALASWITIRVEGNTTRSKTIESNTNNTNAQLQKTVEALNATALAGKDKQIADLTAAAKGAPKI